MPLGLRDSELMSGLARAAHVGLAFVVALASLFVAPTTASAQSDVAIEIGYGGFHNPGSDLLVQVQVEADRLIDGELQITMPRQGVPTTVIVPLELAGGAQKRVSAVLPSVAQWDGNVFLQIVEGGSVVWSAERRVENNTAELIGVMPSLSQRDLPAGAELSVPTRAARLFPIDDALISLGPGAIDALSTVVTTTADLAGLSAPAQNALTTWVQLGGQLIVDDAAGPIQGFDVVATKSGAPYRSGTIIAGTGAFARGEWDNVIPPAPAQLNGDQGMGLLSEITGEANWFGGSLANALGQDAGFGLPPASVVVPIMVLYVLLVGPLAFLVLRRMGRSRALWLALPAFALLFTLIVWLGGSSLRSATTDAHGTVIEIENGSAIASTNVLRSSARGGVTDLSLTPGWKPLQQQDFRFGPTGGAPTIIRPSSEGTRVEAALDAGQFVLLGGTGPVPQYDDALAIVADVNENGMISGSVTNQLAIDLEEVAVFSGFRGTSIGTIGAGETLTFRIGGADRDPRFGEPLEFQVWPSVRDQANFGPFGNQGVTDESAFSVELWNNYMVTNPGRVRPAGVVTVVGWTRDLAAPVDASIADGRTAIIARQDIPLLDGAIIDVASKRVLLTAPDENFGPGAFDQGFRVGTTWMFDVPPEIGSDGLALSLPASAVEAEVWNGDTWLVLEDAEALRYALPPEAVIDGAVFVEVTVDFERRAMLGSNFAVVTVDPNDSLNQALLELQGAS